MRECSCDRFEYLVGAAIKAYSADFLERTGADPEQGLAFYRCRVCGTPWKRVDRKDQSAPGATLVRLPRQENV
ncbi:MAG: hypothetical protein ABI882_14645 [Acidobacteriota bacterium]